MNGDDLPTGPGTPPPPTFGPDDPFVRTYQQIFKRAPGADELAREAARRERKLYGDVPPIDLPPAMLAKSEEQPSFAERVVLNRLSPEYAATREAYRTPGTVLEHLGREAGRAAVGLARFPLDVLGATTHAVMGPTPAERANVVAGGQPPETTAADVARMASPAPLVKQFGYDPAGAMAQVLGMEVGGAALPAAVEGMARVPEAAGVAAESFRPPSVTDYEALAHGKLAGEELLRAGMATPEELQAAGIDVTPSPQAPGGRPAPLAAPTILRRQGVLPQPAEAIEAEPPPAAPTPGLGERGAVPWDVEPGGRLYSRTQRALERAPFEKGTPQQWLALLEKAPGGTFREEAERSGLKQLLEGKAGPQLDLLQAGQRTLTKQEVLAAFQANPLQIEEHYRSRTPSPAQQGTPRYEQYTLPGPVNYREIILSHRVPASMQLPSGWRVARTVPSETQEGRFAVLDGDDQPVATGDTPGQAIDAARDVRPTPFATVPRPYRAGHWPGIDNPIVHLRLSDRQIGGQATTFLEEIQSDVHQQGREQGYADPAARAAAEAAMAQARQAELETQAKIGEQLTAQMHAEPKFLPGQEPAGGRPEVNVMLGPVHIGKLYGTAGGVWRFAGDALIPDFGLDAHAIEPALAVVKHDLTVQPRYLQRLLEHLTDQPQTQEQAVMLRETWERAEARREEAETRAEAATGGVPKLPFSRTEDWASLAVRRALDEAVQAGHPKLGWTTGEQQAARYDLSKHVDRIEYNPGIQRLAAFKNDRTVADESDVPPEKLPSYLGAEITRRLLDTKAATEEGGALHVLQGQDLRYGGAGMKNFYDTMLPKIVKEQLRKLGAKVEPKLEPMEGGGAGGTFTTDTNVRDFARDQTRGQLREFLLDVYNELPGEIDQDDIAHAIEAVDERWRDEAVERLADSWREDQAFDEDAAREDASSYVSEQSSAAHQMLRDIDTGRERLPYATQADLEALGDAHHLTYESLDFWEAMMRQLEKDYDAPYTRDDLQEAFDQVEQDMVDSSVESARDEWTGPGDPPWDELHDQAAEEVGRVSEEATHELEHAQEGGQTHGNVWTVDIPPDLAAKVKAEGQPLGAAPGGVLLPLAGAGVGAAAGAAADKEHRLRGAVLGGLGGAGAGAVLSALLGRRAAALPPPEEAGGVALGAEPEIAPPEPAQAHGAPAEPIGGAPGTVAAAGPTNIVPPDFLERTRKKYPVPAQAEAVAQRAAQIVQEQGLDAARPVSWKETQAAADQLALDPSEIAKTRALRLNAAELTAVKDIVGQNETRILALQQQLPTLPEERVPGALAELDRLEQANGDAISVLLRASSQKGRDLNILKKLAQDTRDPATWMVKAQRMAGRPLTDEMKTEIRKLLAANDPDALARYVESLRTETLAGGILRGYVMGLVSVPSIIVKAAVGGVAHTVLERLKDPVAGTLDLLAAGVANLLPEATSLRTKPVHLGIDLDVATARGAAQGLRNVLATWQGKKVEDPIGGDLLQSEAKAKAGGLEPRIDPSDYGLLLRPAAHLVNAYNRYFSNYVARAHTAYFATLNRAGVERAMIEEAWAQAKNEGAKEGTPKFAERQQWWLDNPTAEMQLRAIDYGARMSLTHRTFFSEVARAAKQLAATHGGAAGRALTTIAMPITRVPASALSITTSYSPFGFLAGASDIPKWIDASLKDAADLPAIQKRMVERLARAGTGSAVILAGYLLAKAGRMTGAQPETPEEARVWKERGIGPYSLRIGTSYRNVSVMPPAGFLLAFGASLYDIWNRARTPTGGVPTVAERLGASAAVPAKVALETPMLTGPQKIIEGIAKPQQAGPAAVRTLASSAVPGLVRTAARALDPYERAPEGPLEAMQAAIPGLSTRVPPRLTGLGDRVQHAAGWSQVLDPTRPRADLAQTDPLVRELVSQGSAPQPIARLPHETAEQYTRRAELTGKYLRFRLNALVRSPEYQEAKALETEGRAAITELQQRVPSLRGATPEQLLEAYYAWRKQEDPSVKTARELLDLEARQVHGEAAAAFFGPHRTRPKLAPVP